MQKKGKKVVDAAVPVIIIWPHRTDYYDSIEEAADATGVTVSTIINSIGNADSHFNGHSGAYVEQAVVSASERPHSKLSEEKRAYRLQHQLTQVKAAYEDEELKYNNAEVSELTGVAEWRVTKFAPYYANCKKAQQWAWSDEAVERFQQRIGV